ncbi:hypothetical protein ACOSQ2_004760 [Xanthoceras sorbifolium]
MSRKQHEFAMYKSYQENGSPIRSTKVHCDRLWSIVTVYSLLVQVPLFDSCLAKKTLSNPSSNSFIQD